MIWGITNAKANQSFKIDIENSTGKMDHLAIMKKSWGLLPKILSGEKIIESRWYEHKVAPWGGIKPGDNIYFKNSGEPVTARANVGKVIQIEIADRSESYQDLLFPENEGVISVGDIDVETILRLFAHDDGIEIEQIPAYASLFKDKKYCILIYLKNTRPVTPFEIDKSGFGTMSAWITVPGIEAIKK